MIINKDLFYKNDCERLKNLFDEKLKDFYIYDFHKEILDKSIQEFLDSEYPKLLIFNEFSYFVYYDDWKIDYDKLKIYLYKKGISLEISYKIGDYVESAVELMNRFFERNK